METKSATTLLDTTKRNRNRDCGKLSAVGKVLHEGQEVYGYARLYCKGWSCPFCAPRKAAVLRQRIADLAKRHNLTRLLTLTLDPSKIPDENQAKYLREVWRKFRVYMAREFKRSISFISVMEETQAGIPHLHVLVDRYIPHSWISDKWERLGGGKIVHIEAVHDLEATGGYLGKYLTKEMIEHGAKRARRVTTSRDIKLRNPDEDSGWRFISQPLEDVYKTCQEQTEIITVNQADDGEVKFFTADRFFLDDLGVSIDATVQ